MIRTYVYRIIIAFLVYITELTSISYSNFMYYIAVIQFFKFSYKLETKINARRSCIIEVKKVEFNIEYDKRIMLNLSLF